MPQLPGVVAEILCPSYSLSEPIDIVSSAQFGYTASMRKTTIVIDEELLREASDVLGTHGLKATVDRALKEIVAIEARKQVIEQLRTMDGLDLDNEEVMSQAWR